MFACAISDKAPFSLHLTQSQWQMIQVKTAFKAPKEFACAIDTIGHAHPRTVHYQFVEMSLQEPRPSIPARNRANDADIHLHAVTLLNCYALHQVPWRDSGLFSGASPYLNPWFARPLPPRSLGVVYLLPRTTSTGLDVLEGLLRRLLLRLEGQEGGEIDGGIV